MKKLLKSLAFLAVAAVAQSAFAGAQWLGNSYISANGIWYQERKVGPPAGPLKATISGTLPASTSVASSRLVTTGPTGMAVPAIG